MPLRFRFLIVIPGFFAGCDQRQAAPPAAPPEVLVLPAAVRDVPVYREWTGTLDGSENAEIRARVTGYLLKRNYQEGGLVKKDDVLFEIDPRPFESALSEAKSQLAQGQAEQVASQAEYERNKLLFDKKVVSEKEYVNRTQMNLSNVAKVAALKAAVEQAELNLRFCTILAPVEGVAGISRAQVGDLVGTGSNVVLASVSTLDPIKVVFPISEAEYLGASSMIKEALATPLQQREGLIEVILADGKPFEKKARLLAVDLSVKGSTGTILVTGILENPGSVLRPGLFARARVIAKALKDAVLVPQRAVHEVQGTYQLGIVGADGRAEIRPVRTGPRTGSEWVISEGLRTGESVIVEGLMKVKAGIPVLAKPWVPPAAVSAPTPGSAAAAPPAPASGGASATPVPAGPQPPAR